MIDETTFVRDNAAVWKELESEVRYFNKRMNFFGRLFARTKMNKKRVDNLLVLYNKTANHLAYCRTYFGETDTADYLNRLLGSAHSLIYMRHPFRAKDIFTGLGVSIPKLFRKRYAFFLVAAALMIIPGIISFFYTASDMRNAFAFIDPATVESVRAEGNYDNLSAADSAFMSAYIGRNNIQVCLIAFAGGVTLGAYTAFVLVYNGLMVGALAGVYWQIGSSKFFWSMILPHGITELFAIMLSGAAGLLVAYSLINPGKISRKNALVERGIEACKLMVAVVLLLAVSAVIEGYFSPLPLPYAAKYGFSFAMLGLLCMYLLLPGRNIAAKIRGKHGRSKACISIADRV